MTKRFDWEKIRKGDQLVFDRMFECYYHSLCSFASYYINDRQVVEDIVIDCFTKIWEEHENLEIRSSLSNYLITIVKNSTISYLRKQQHQSTRIEGMPDSITEEAEDPLKDAVILNKLYEAINKMPGQRRKILKMAAFEEKSYADIARELNISVNTVKTQMSRAYKFLKEELRVSQQIIYFLLFM